MRPALSSLTQRLAIQHGAAARCRMVHHQCPIVITAMSSPLASSIFSNINDRNHLGMKSTVTTGNTTTTTNMATATTTDALMSRRSFSTQPEKATVNEPAVTEGKLTYFARKRARKEERRALNRAKRERKERLKTRRQGRTRGIMKEEFDKFFLKKQAMERHWVRQAKHQGLEWKINVAVILERTNVHLPPRTDWENEFYELEAYLDTVRGRDWPDFIKYGPKDDTFGGFDDISEEDLAGSKKNEEKEEDPLNPPDIYAELTEADKTGDIRTIDRKRADHIFLVVKEENGVGEEDSDMWHFPTVALQEDETLLQAARRALSEKVGPGVEYWCPSNAPWSVRLTRFPLEERKESGFYGTKTFFMKLEHWEGDLPKDDTLAVKDFAWMDRGEVSSFMKESLGDYHGTFYHYML